jgi:hypothetical protein
MMEHDADREMGFLAPIEHHMINIYSLADEDEMQQAPHISVATPPPTYRPILPTEATGIPETRELAYPSPRPTQNTLEGEETTEPYGSGVQKGHEMVDKGGNHTRR